jgi:PTH1 family peptidyl-tRNA hydrolase
MTVKMIAGLGNPGSQYAGTPHNIGFDVVELLCRRLNGAWHEERRFSGRVAKVSTNAEAVLLVQPMTYMNASGACVGPLMRYYRMAAADVTAILDDADLPCGKIRIRPEGGSGGHNGLSSLIASLGTEAFPRVRLGIGRGAHANEKLKSHVLSKSSPETRRILEQVVPVAADAVECIIRTGVTQAMNVYNRFTPEEKLC